MNKKDLSPQNFVGFASKYHWLRSNISKYIAKKKRLPKVILMHVDILTQLP